MTTKDLKKGDRILLAYGEQDGDLAGCSSPAMLIRMGFNRHPNPAATELFIRRKAYTPWEATLLEKPNQRDGTVMAEVEGFETESGSIYNYDILAVKDERGEWKWIERTEPEEKLKIRVSSIQ